MNFKRLGIILYISLASATAASASSAGHPTWQKYSDAGSEAFREKRFDDAEKYFELAVNEAEKFGFDDDRLATSLNDLANTYDANYHYETTRVAKFKDAEQLYKRALQIREKLLGPNHLEVAQTLSDFAAWCQKDLKYSEPLNRRALEIREKALGPEHSDVAQSLYQLAEVFNHMERKSEAEPLYKRALAIWERTPASDEKIALCLDGLAETYLRTDREAEAEPHLKRALGIWEKQSKREFTALDHLHKLTVIYRKQSNQKGLEEVYKHYLAITEERYGAESPQVGHDLEELAKLYRDQERYEEAEPLYVRILAIRTTMLGEENSSERTAIDLSALKPIIIGAKDFSPKHENLRSASQRRLEALKTKFPALVKSQKYSSGQNSGEQVFFRVAARLLVEQGNNAAAEAFLKLDLANAELCPDYDALGASNYQLGLIYYKQKKYAKAEVMFKRSARIFEKLFGSESENLGTNLSLLASCYQHQGNYAEAERDFKRALEIAEKKCKEHSGSEIMKLPLLGNLAALYCRQHRYSEAEPLYKSWLTIYETSHAQENAIVSRPLKDYAALLRKTKRIDEAAKLEAKYNVAPEKNR